MIDWLNDYVDAKKDKVLNRKSKHLVKHSINPESLKISILFSLILLVPFSFMANGLVGGLANIMAVASAQVCNLYLYRTIWSWLPFAASFSLQTVFIAQSSPTALWPSWQFVSIAACVGAVAHILNGLADITIDKQAKLGGLDVSHGR